LLTFQFSQFTGIETINRNIQNIILYHYKCTKRIEKKMAKIKTTTFPLENMKLSMIENFKYRNDYLK